VLAPHSLVTEDKIFPTGTVAVTASFEPGSYRDRRARVFHQANSVFRALTEEGLEAWRTLARTHFFQEFTKAGKLVTTQLTPEEARLGFDLSDRWVAVIEHERIPFVSYAYEWSFGMLQDAALLQLELIEALQ
jgi:hypothetical protein